jgi:hypothetical protein
MKAGDTFEGLDEMEAALGTGSLAYDEPNRDLLELLDYLEGRRKTL